MDIRPHPTKKRKAIVRVDDYQEHADLAFSPLLNITRRSLRYLREYWYGSDKSRFDYPREITLTRNQLGHIAGSLLAGELYSTDDVRSAQTIVNFLVSQVVAIDAQEQAVLETRAETV